MKYFLIISVLIFNLNLHSQENDGNKLVKVIYNFETNEIKPNDSVTIIARFTPAKDWHTYWKNPGDAGLASNLEFTLPDGFRVSELKWEYPKSFPFDNMLNFGYSETSHLIFTIYSPPKIPKGEFNIVIKSSWLVCKDICLSGSKTDTLAFNNINDMYSFPDFRLKLKSISSRVPDLINNPNFFAEKNGNEVILKWNKNINLPDNLSIFPIQEGFFKYKSNYEVKEKNGFKFVVLEMDNFRVSEPENLQLVLVSENGFINLSNKKAIELHLSFNK